VRIDSYRAWGLVLLVWFCATLSLGLQSLLGDATIYSKRLEERREQLHYAILANQPPVAEGWGAVGALTLQKRVGVVYLAEQIRRLTGWTPGKVYKALDSLFLFAFLVGLFFYLRRWLPDLQCALGLLYVAAVLPFTYFFQLFHPWDRLQLALWLLLFYLVLERKTGMLALGLVLSIFVKYDTIMLPVFYAMVHYRRAAWQRVALETIVLLALAVAAYQALGWLFPAPMDKTNFNDEGALKMLATNLQTMLQMNLRFPPLVVLGAPLVLACCGWSSQSQALKASVAFGVLLSAMFLLFSRYEEVRAQMVVLVLLLPSALLGLARFFDRKPTRAGEPGAA
jgi:hypothetical protein